ncbi:MAG: sulfurtransferase TusA family protein [Novosphingobium sp.]|nr:sulfurtransferase TusA family protein [Novosphingobium sp.]
MIVDARGLRCPWPAIRAARALRTHQGPVDVITDDPAAATELAKLAESLACGFWPIKHPSGTVFRLGGQTASMDRLPGTGRTDSEPSAGALPDGGA